VDINFDNGMYMSQLEIACIIFAKYGVHMIHVKEMEMWYYLLPFCGPGGERGGKKNNFRDLFTCESYRVFIFFIFYT
jgi:hypothetical protein